LAAAFCSAVQVHHWPLGTPLLTCEMCWPQPAQVVLEQALQVTGRHMVIPLDQ
jgi:hypothetical protein